MALNINDPSATNPAATPSAPNIEPPKFTGAATSAGTSTGFSAPPQAVTTQRPWTFGDGAMTGPISHNEGTEALNTLRDTMQDIFTKEATDGVSEVRLLALDNQQHNGLYYSSVLVCMTHPKSSVQGVAVYALLLACTNAAPSSRVENILGEQTEIKVVPGDAFDYKYIAAIMEAVSLAYPGKPIYNVGGMIVPERFDLDSKSGVRALCYNASTAVFSELKQRYPNFSDINLTAANGDETLQVNVQYGNETAQNCAGEPQRANVTVQFTSAVTNNDGTKSLNDLARRGTTFGNLRGFIEAIWAPVQQHQAAWGMYNQGMVPATQKYAARFVITDMESTKVATLPAYLLLLLTAQPVGQGNNWFGVFYGTEKFHDKKNGPNFMDVGALNIEANLPTAKNPNGNPNGIGDRIDTQASDFTPDVFNQYMSRLFRPGLSYAIDVPLTGPQSWYLDVIRAANSNRPEAIAAYRAAANQLTNGHYTTILKDHESRGKNSPLFLERDNIIHMGYYEDNNGNLRDVRDIDQLAVLNFFGEKNDVTAARRWSDSFLATNIPIHKRLATRWQIIQAMTKNRAVCTGFAVRATFSDLEIEVLNLAAHAAGLNIRANIPMTGLGHQPDRATAGWISQAMVSSNYNPLFYQGNLGGTQAAAPGNFGTHQYSRFG